MISDFVYRMYGWVRALFRNPNDTFEEKVELRTKELAEANDILRAELNEREDAERIATELHRAMEHSPNAVLLTDPEGVIQYVNLKFTERLTVSIVSPGRWNW